MTQDSSAPTGLPAGFLWGATRAGIKASGNPDVALAFAPRGAACAAMFTSNQVVAAPILVGRRHLAETAGRVSALLVNAGNANCATGEPGVRAAVETTRAAAEGLGCIFDEVIPSSTGIIGVPLPAEKILAVLPNARQWIGPTLAHAEAFAEAILTTDTRRKIARAVIEVDGAEGRAAPGQVRIFGVAKGAGMIQPRLIPAAPHATMLVYLFTDLAATPAELDSLLEPAVHRSFNAISIDGDTSTNDTVLLLASGLSGISLGPRVAEAFANALQLVTGSLAHQIVADGEGVTHVVTLDIRGAATEADALTVARSIANSPLNKTAWSSADPNWGRLLAAAGYSGVVFDPALVTIWIGQHLVFEHGVRAASFDQDAAHQTMLEREYTITLDLGQGQAACTFLTCDLTEEYVRINADYST